MKRRDFIALVGAAAAFPRAAFAQQAAGRKRVGLLFFGGNPDGSATPLYQVYTDAVRAGLKEEGFIEGTSVTLDSRLGLNDVGLARAAARDLVGAGYDVLFGAATPATAPLFAETKTIPIVFASASDPIGDGFVKSFARPGGNVTGFTNVDASMGGKWLELLHQIAPGVRRAALILNPAVAPGGGNFFVPSFQAAAAAFGIEPVVVGVRTLAEIDAAVTDMGKALGTGVVVNSDSYTLSNRRTVIDAVARANMAAIYPFEEFVTDGGLVSYGSDQIEVYRQAGRYIGLILKGAKPADLPVQAPTKFILSVNLKTARAQRITIPPILIATADKVIE